MNKNHNQEKVEKVTDAQWLELMSYFFDTLQNYMHDIQQGVDSMKNDKNLSQEAKELFGKIESETNGVLLKLGEFREKQKNLLKK